MTATFDLERWLETSRSAALRGTLPDISGSPMATILAAQALYLPELAAAVANLDVANNAEIQWLLNLADPAQAATQQQNVQRYPAIHRSLLTALGTVRRELADALYA